MPKYRLTPEADADLENIFSFGVDTFGIEQAITYTLALEHRLKNLEKPQSSTWKSMKFAKGTGAVFAVFTQFITAS